MQTILDSLRTGDIEVALPEVQGTSLQLDQNAGSQIIETEDIRKYIEQLKIYSNSGRSGSWTFGTDRSGVFMVRIDSFNPEILLVIDNADSKIMFDHDQVLKLESFVVHNFNDRMANRWTPNQ